MKRAFTLIELMVVIGIVVIMLAVAVPTIRALTKGNGQKQAVNLLTMMLANARATAISTHKMSGIVVYEDPTSKSQDSIQLITQSNYDPNGEVRYFVRLPHTVAQALPKGVEVAMLDDSNINKNIRTNVNGASSRCRAIMFDSNGQLAMVAALAADNAIAGDPIVLQWNMKGSAVSSSSGVSSPGFMVYDRTAFANSGQSTPVLAAAWMKNNADILIVNPYTGTIIR